jgi:acetylornithine deacetylase/succinyl-diaminopimelate desuccinylase-like protein
MDALDQIRAYLNVNQARFEEELFEFLRFPSISASSTSGPDILACAEWLVGKFSGLGLQAEILPTRGHPAVVAETPRRPGLPTVLVYGHYDVQPVDPVDLWRTPPFEPSVKDGVVYARGATDDKGQLYTHVKAAEAWIRTAGETPVNLIYLIEGEEEIGSPNLEAFILEHRDRFQADAVIISDTSQFGPGQPALCYALRGLTYMEFIVTGANQDLHSGMFGGIVPNPAQVVAGIVAGLKNADGSIAIPGFYDGVKPPEDWEVREYQELPWDFEEMARQLGLPHLSGEQSYPIPVRKWCRPTLDVNGIYGGYAGKGAKTVIPSQAGAKVSMRLVPGQDANRIADLFEGFVRERIPSDCKVEILRYQNSPATVIPVEDPAMQAAKEAFRFGFGKEPLLIREGASIPVVAFFVDVLRMPVVLFGFGLPDDNLHAPNEKFTLADFHRGIAASACFMDVYPRIRR